ncbi:MAG: TrbC/VirB2 family protein [Bacteriovoracaceae bacterium]|nr:TrbC/VirB2 family protein [Bacteriovoracaceae bacterium]
MNKKIIIYVSLVLLAMAIALLPEMSFAQVGGFDSKVNSLTNLIVGKILPAVAVFGLIYAAILAAAGDESSKKRMVLVIVASIVGILAKFIVPMFQGAV